MQISDRRVSLGFRRAGLTLVEVTVIVMIILILTTISLRFRANDRIEKESSRRLAAAIMTAFDKPKLDALSGRAINIGTTAAPNFINPAFVRISVATGAIVTQYMSGAYTVVNGVITGVGNVAGTGNILKWPYFNDKYFKIIARGTIKSDGSRAILANTGTLYVDMMGSQAYFTGSDAAAMSGAVGIQIVADYKGWRSMVEFDARSGRVGSYFDKYPGCNQPDIKLANGQVWAACNVQQGGKGCGAPKCGLEADTKNLFQWGWSDGSWVTGREPAPSGKENQGSWTGTQQGPCAIGYHVPTITDWSGAISTAGSALSVSNILFLGAENTIPHRDGSNGVIYLTSNGYWTSTTTSTSDVWRFKVAEGNTSSPITTDKHARPVRCIRNP